MNFNAERMPVQASTFMISWNSRQPMRGFKPEFFNQINFKAL